MQNKKPTAGEVEQNERIIEQLAEYHANPQAYSFSDWEDIFEDRDPFEFL